LVSAPFPEFVPSDVGYGVSWCRAAEALERQEPFVNPTLANHSRALLARLFRYGDDLLSRCPREYFVDSAVQALPIDPKYWSRLRKRGQTKPVIGAQKPPGSDPPEHLF
jgi:hypothetical protein